MISEGDIHAENYPIIFFDPIQAWNTNKSEGNATRDDASYTSFISKRPMVTKVNKRLWTKWQWTNCFMNPPDKNPWFTERRRNRQPTWILWGIWLNSYELNRPETRFRLYSVISHDNSISNKHVQSMQHAFQWCSLFRGYINLQSSHEKQ